MRLNIIRQSPLLAVAVMLTLGTAIGAVSTVLGFLAAIWLDPLPYREPERLVALLRGDREDLHAFSQPGFRFVEERNRVFDELAIFRTSEVNLSGLPHPLRIKAAAVSANLFETLGVRPEIGRTFTNQEDRPGGPRTVLISHGLWLDAFGHRSALDETIELNGDRYSILGVMPKGFDFPAREIKLWLPVNVFHDTTYDLAVSRLFHSLARLRSGISIRAAEVRLNQLISELKDEPQSDRHRPVRLVSLAEQMRSHIRRGVSLQTASWGNVRGGLFLVLGVAALLLLTACANVTNLLLMRTWTRQRVIAVQLSLGADHRRIVTATLGESMCLAFGAGMIGLFLAWLGTHLAFRLIPADIPLPGEQPASGRILLISLALGAFSISVPGLLQSMRLIRVDPVTSLLQEGMSTYRSSPSSLANGFVVLEFAVAALLLCSSGLFLRSFVNMAAVEPGYSPANVVSVNPFLPKIDFPVQPEPILLFRRLEHHLETIPSVVSVARTSAFPLGQFRDIRSFRKEGTSEAPEREIEAQAIAVSMGYLELMGIAVVKGRSFSESDTEYAENVAIVDEGTAERLWPGHDPLGKRLQLQTSLYQAPWRTVVGVTRSVRSFGLSDTLGRRLFGQVYIPIEQREMREPTESLFAIKTKADSPLPAAALRQRVGELAPSLPIEIVSLEEKINRHDAHPKFYLALLGSLGVLTLVMAAGGAYSTLHFRVRQREHEMGVRMAVGAGRASIRRLLLIEGLKLALPGIGLGLLAALATTRLLAGFLFGLTPTDPLTFAIVAGGLTVAALMSSLIPARAAATADPVALFRYQ